MTIETCPKCGGGFNTNHFTDDLEFFRCESCSGLLMKKSVFQQLKTAWLSEIVIDSPHVPVGRAVDNLKIECPRCNNPMSEFVDPVQSHICLDFCAHCDLLYFDAGEFTDLKQLTMMDHVWSFLAKLKSR